MKAKAEEVNIGSSSIRGFFVVIRPETPDEAKLLEGVYSIESRIDRLNPEYFPYGKMVFYVTSRKEDDSMPKIWGTQADVERDLETLKAYEQAGGGVPPELIEAVKTQVRKTSNGLRLHFFRLLPGAAPGIIREFMQENRTE